MGNAQSYAAASVSAFTVYFLYAHIYCSHTLLLTRDVLSSDRLPSPAFLLVKYLLRALTRTPGHLYTSTSGGCEVLYTVSCPRLDEWALRRFCSAAGFGWDYPDSEFRDIPLCFPQFLCGTLLLLVQTDRNFRLSPAGLIPVRQTLSSHQPVDELKKGPFTLQVRVLEYRRVDCGVEVDVCMSAASRSQRPVWDSVVTLLSENQRHRAVGSSGKRESQTAGSDGDGDVKQVDVRVPWSCSLACVWPLTDYWHLSPPASPVGYRVQTVPSLWMLSVCLAEMEKHNGVEVVTAPASITARFKDPHLASGRVTIAFWEKTRSSRHLSELNFQMQHQASGASLVVGVISRS